MQQASNDFYLPQTAVITKVVEENSQIKTFSLRFEQTELQEKFTYQPGQFMMVSVPHCGEAPISFSSSPVPGGDIELSVRRAGKLTSALHEMNEGDLVGLRGPYGKPFPMAELAGNDLLFVAGGIGLAPLRSVINACLAERERYGAITILYGSRLPSDIAFQEDIQRWQQLDRVDCHLTVDQAETGWTGPVGVVTGLLAGVTGDPHSTTALVCGPPLMIRAVLESLSQKGYEDKKIITTMERHMKCGVGHCRHCHMDDKLVCVDGPVFSLAELRKLEVMELGG